MRKLVGNERTSVVKSRAPAVVAAAAPSSELYTSDFQRLVPPTPFTVNLRGVVSAVQPEVTSQAGNVMKHFRLQDNTGRFVNCVAFGRHVDNAFIEDNEEVVLYFAKGMEGLNQGPGQMWMYDDSHIASLGARRGVPPATTCVTLR